VVFDHIGFKVTDFPKTKDFLVRALQPLGMGITAEGEGWAMIGRTGEGQLWFGSFGGSPGPIHIAFAAKTRDEVRKFHEAALASGGKDNGAPGLRPSPSFGLHG
jgi:catechol 2,3-dioxygenase-like lactoylglutathione lyase family enzyme